MVENYQELANAIIVQASRDYIKYFVALKELKKIDMSRLKDRQKKKLEGKINLAEGDLNEVKSFFHSEWYKQLTNLDPDVIMHKLELEVAA